MKRIILRVALSIAFIPIAHSVYSQLENDKVVTKNKNIIYTTLGFYGLGGTVNGGYQRYLGESHSKFFVSYWLGGDYGIAALWEDEYRYMNVDFTALTGSRKSHLELCAGLATFKDMWTYNHREPHTPTSHWRSYAPTGSVGYRFQKPEGWFIFRTGIGFPDGIYVSCGFRF